MLDPLGPPPAWLRRFVEPYAVSLSSPTLSEHIHEVFLAFAFYQFIHSYLSPWLSPILFPRSYTKLSARTKLNWDIHVVSLIQSVLINALALWIMFTDKERNSMSAGERVYGYTGACGLIQALAVGYFIYDIIVSTVYVRIFGIGVLFHAVSALWVFSLSFVSSSNPYLQSLLNKLLTDSFCNTEQRPFLNYYAPVFILYELSTPFLNIHWFLDKVDMTGSRTQWYNGMLLLSVFFSCRLIWGTWQSAVVYQDMCAALQQKWSASAGPLQEPVNINAQVFFPARDGSICIDETCARANAEIARFKDFTATGVPTWLVLTYITSNLVLNFLNYFWFFKMVETVFKRFRTPDDASDSKIAASQEKTGEAKKTHAVPNLSHDVVIEAAAKLEQEEAAMMQGDLSLSSKQGSSATDASLTDDLRKRRA